MNSNILLATLFLTFAGASDPVVDLSYSKYSRGKQLNGGITQWLSVRYAAPPLGLSRFKIEDMGMIVVTLNYRVGLYGFLGD